MGAPPDNFSQLGAASKQIVRQLATIGENRFELLMMEVQEERERVLRAFLLALGVAVFGVLGGLTLTGAILVLFLPCSPLSVLLALSGLYAISGICLYWRFTRLLQDWQTLPASLDQIRKDRACLEELLT